MPATLGTEITRVLNMNAIDIRSVILDDQRKQIIVAYALGQVENGIFYAETNRSITLSGRDERKVIERAEQLRDKGFIESLHEAAYEMIVSGDPDIDTRTELVFA